jgi:heme/copper-type cytochrome/quinol oxidase subunit 3
METCLKSRRALFFTWLIVETVLFGILVAIYFSVWMTVNLFVLLVSLIPGIMLDRAARKKDEKKIKILLPTTLAVNIVAIVLRFFEFDALYFRWDDNA